jgi:hypothetical protein
MIRAERQIWASAGGRLPSSSRPESARPSGTSCAARAKSFPRRRRSPQRKALPVSGCRSVHRGSLYRHPLPVSRPRCVFAPRALQRAAGAAPGADPRGEPGDKARRPGAKRARCGTDSRARRDCRDRKEVETEDGIMRDWLLPAPGGSLARRRAPRGRGRPRARPSPRALVFRLAALYASVDTQNRPYVDT